MYARMDDIEKEKEYARRLPLEMKHMLLNQQIMKKYRDASNSADTNNHDTTQNLHSQTTKKKST
jgi:hypothetical protein